MYVCLFCRQLFEKPITVGVQTVDWHGDPAAERMAVSPCCEDEFVEADGRKRCSICGEYITGKYVQTENDELFCSECYIERDITEDD